MMQTKFGLYFSFFECYIFFLILTLSLDGIMESEAWDIGEKERNKVLASSQVWFFEPFKS